MSSSRFLLWLSHPREPLAVNLLDHGRSPARRLHRQGAFRPCPAFAERVVQRSLDLGSAPEVYRPALIAELRDRPYEFDVQVQLCTDLARMPVEDVTVEWPEALSAFVTVAKLRIPQQDISGDDNLEKMDALSFTPWRVTAEHKPLGSIMRARREVYHHSSGKWQKCRFRTVG